MSKPNPSRYHGGPNKHGQGPAFIEPDTTNPHAKTGLVGKLCDDACGYYMYVYDEHSKGEGAEASASLGNELNKKSVEFEEEEQFFTEGGAGGGKGKKGKNKGGTKGKKGKHGIHFAGSKEDISLTQQTSAVDENEMGDETEEEGDSGGDEGRHDGNDTSGSGPDHDKIQEKENNKDKAKKEEASGKKKKGADAVSVTSKGSKKSKKSKKSKGKSKGKGRSRSTLGKKKVQKGTKDKDGKSKEQEPSKEEAKPVPEVKGPEQTRRKSLPPKLEEGKVVPEVKGPEQPRRKSLPPKPDEKEKKTEPPGKQDKSGKSAEAKPPEIIKEPETPTVEVPEESKKKSLGPSKKSEKKSKDGGDLLLPRNPSNASISSNVSNTGIRRKVSRQKFPKDKDQPTTEETKKRRKSSGPAPKDQEDHVKPLEEGEGENETTKSKESTLVPPTEKSKVKRKSTMKGEGTGGGVDLAVSVSVPEGEGEGAKGNLNIDKGNEGTPKPPAKEKDFLRPDKGRKLSASSVTSIKSNISVRSHKGSKHKLTVTAEAEPVPESVTVTAPPSEVKESEHKPEMVMVTPSIITEEPEEEASTKSIKKKDEKGPPESTPSVETEKTDKTTTTKTKSKKGKGTVTFSTASGKSGGKSGKSKSTKSKSTKGTATATSKSTKTSKKGKSRSFKSSSRATSKKKKDGIKEPPPPPDTYFWLRKNKTSILIETYEQQPISELKQMIAGIVKMAPDAFTIYKDGQEIVDKKPEDNKDLGKTASKSRDKIKDKGKKDKDKDSMKGKGSKEGGDAGSGEPLKLIDFGISATTSGIFRPLSLALSYMNEENGKFDPVDITPWSKGIEIPASVRPFLRNYDRILEGDIIDEDNDSVPVTPVRGKSTRSLKS